MRSFKSLQGRLLLGIMLISACVTSIVVIVSFYVDYDDELANQNKMFLQIEALSVPALARPIWDIDEKGISAQISALETIRDIVKVSVFDQEKNLILSSAEKQGLEIDEVREYPIFSDKDFQDEPMQIGLLRVEVTKKFIFDRLLKNFFIFFLSQFVKTLIVSSLIFWFIYNLVTKRILTLRGYLSENEMRAIEKWTPFRPNFSGKYSDELTELENVLNRQIEKIVALNLKNNELILSQSEEIDSQRQKAIESARLAALGELSGGIAHEINNPLAIISLSVKNIQIAIQKNEGPEKLALHLSKVNKMVDRMAKIISAMKISVRDGSSDPIVPVSVNEVISEVLILSQAKISSTGVRLETHLSKNENLKINAREVQVLQILVNILNNAFDAVVDQKNAWIRLEVCTDNINDVEFKVTDSGPGIPKDLQAKLFNPFFTTKEIGHGVGLGLSISKSNATANRGDLYLDTKCENTSFVLRLPKAA
jgi:phosphoglycerate-specific signal transduction histidine kinase